MKFSCDRCQTRYSIGDEKVRGKVLKIRCKTCGNIVVVREQTASSQAASAQGAAAFVKQELAVGDADGGSAGVADSGAVAAGDKAGGVDWFIAIKGKQHGPTKADGVAKLFHDGVISERSYLWNDTMTAWTRLRDVPAFKHLAAEAQAKKAAPPPPPPDDPSGAEVVFLDEARQQRQRDQAPTLGGLPPAPPRSATPGPMHDPFAAVAPQGSLPDNTPRDSTRVFIMQAGLHNRAQKHRVAAGIAIVLTLALFGVCVLDYKGVVQIPGLHGVVSAVTNRQDSDYQMPGATWEEGEEDPALVCKLRPDKDKCVTEVQKKNATLRIRKQRLKQAGGTGIGDMKLDDAFNQNAGAEAAGVGGGLAANGGGDGFVGVGASGAAVKAVFQNDGKKLVTPTIKSETPTVSGSALDVENVSKVVKEGLGGVQACVEQNAKTGGDMPGGKQRLILTVEPKGTVSKAQFQNGAVSASPVGECIRGAAKRWKFQAFPGEATDIDIPLILSM